jgi:4-alpha-glucanotransferase
MTSTLGHDRADAAGESSTFYLRRLAEHVGIMPEYFGQTGERHFTSDETRRALLATLGFDASTDDAARLTLERIAEEDAQELIPPVRVVRLRSNTAGALDVRLPPTADHTGAWRLELTLEDGTNRVVEGSWAGGPTLEIALPLDVPLGYHRILLSIASSNGASSNEQTLIVVPDRCVIPSDILGENGAYGLIANLYTIRTDSNWGVGDFSDLAKVAEWGGSVGADFVGVNPLHALLNRGLDISPYSPVSRLFRNPIYIDIQQVPELADAPNVADHLASPEFIEEVEALRETAAVRYEQVMGVKGIALDALHQVFTKQVRGSGSERDLAYEAYVVAHDPGLTRFATWMALAESSGFGSNWHTWPLEFRDSQSDAVRDFAVRREHRVDFHRWVQFELDRQLGAAADRARDAGMRIGLYPDLAIGTSPCGADTWSFPELFVRGASVGAPPDPYAPQGQNWGLPPLNPRALRADRYQYFISLVRSGLRHAGALRMDHILGLFRLFWIPEGRTGEEGAYLRYPTEDLLGILALESVRHNAIVVGEDLGTVPDEVPPTLARWGVLSSKVLQFERDHGGEYKPSWTYPALSLATADTHDMVSIAGFWSGHDIDIRRSVGLIESDEDARRAHEDRSRDRDALLRRLADEHLLPSAVAPRFASDLRGAVHAFLCRSPAQLVGISLDDLTGELEPVNVPGVGPDHYPSWTRKMRETLETMMASDDVRAALRCDGRARRHDVERADGR